MYNNTDIIKLEEYIVSLAIQPKSSAAEYEYTNPVLALVDTVLSINRKYDSFVKPRIELIKNTRIDSFDSLRQELEKGDEYFISLWNYNHPQRR